MTMVKHHADEAQFSQHVAQGMANVAVFSDSSELSGGSSSTLIGLMDLWNCSLQSMRDDVGTNVTGYDIILCLVLQHSRHNKCL